MNDILEVILWTLIPGLELRASIPLGIVKYGLTPILVYVTAVLANIVLGLILYFIVDKIIFVLTKIRIINKLYKLYIIKTQKKLHKSMEKWGILGLAIFVGIPLPGSGVYSGSIGAYVLGIDYKRYSFGTIIGVLIAGTSILLLTLAYGKMPI